jgi:hypothetical protein
MAFWLSPYQKDTACGIMLTISIFFGILIRMFFYDTEKHHTPHIHAEYQENLLFIQ